ncbi:MAG: hypothetical protein FWF95_00570 [Syntrophorhabdaceae bacterium]|nr:hypothetical protein [Syntrophorhabdaceae bacterium]
MKNGFGKAVFFAVLMVVLLPYSLHAACDFFLQEPIVFADNTIRIGDAKVMPFGRTMQGCLSKNKLSGLSDIVIYDRRPGDRTVHYFMSGEDGERIRTKTCSEYLAALKKGMTTKTERDERLAISYRRICGVLNTLPKSVPFKQDYISSKKNISPEALPVFLLVAATPVGEGASYEKLVADSEKEVSFADYLKDKENVLSRVEKIKDNLENTYLETWYGDSEEDGNGFWYEMELIAKGDFNKDGYADFLVHTVKIANKGAWFESDYILLTSKSKSSKLYDVYGSDFSCVYKDKAYSCSDASKGKPLASWSAFE